MGAAQPREGQKMDFDTLDKDLLRIIEKDAATDPTPDSEGRWEIGMFRRVQTPPDAPWATKVRNGRYNGAPDLVAALKLFDAAKQRAEQKGIEFTLRAGWIREKIIAGVCEKTGITFDLEGVYRNGRRQNPWSPSIDRIVPGGPYSPENCQIVVWEYNSQKNISSEEAMEAKSNGFMTVMDKREIEEAAHAHAETSDTSEPNVNLMEIPVYRKLAQICFPEAKTLKMAG
jgi:hypothetical protein